METHKPTDREIRAIALLDDAMRWVIRYGHFVLANRDAEFLRKKLIADWPVQLWVEPVIDTDGDLALFRLKFAGYYYDIRALHREAAGDETYEFWMTQVTAADFATPLRKCFFHVATVAKNEERTLVMEQDSFISAYETPEGSTVSLPVDNPALLYQMRAWRFPNCFPDSKLSEIEAYVEPSGEYATRPAELVE